MKTNAAGLAASLGCRPCRRSRLPNAMPHGAVEQHGEIPPPGVRVPWFDGALHVTVIERACPPEPLRQSFLRPDIVTGKQLQTAETAQQDVLSRPPTHAV